MGLPFLLVAIGAVLLSLALNGRRHWQNPATGPSPVTLFSVLAGVCVTLATAALALHWTAGIGNYVHWTIEYAGQRRLPGFSLMLGVYRDPSLLGTLPCVTVALVLLWVGPRRLSSRSPPCSYTTTPTSAATACWRSGRCCWFSPRR
jgi:hypothetical protein